jgi:argininosuccinate lyase
MPQKRNPDIAELLRGKPARAIGDVVALLTISKGLALAYNKDLQESQEPLYDAIDTARLALGVLPG